MFLKDKDAVLDYAVDWTGVTGAERTVVASIWRVSPEGGLAVLEAAVEGGRAIARLGGGVAGTVYCVGNHVELSDGTRDERTLVVRVEER